MSIKFGKCVANKKYKSSTVSIEMSPILFKDVFTFGVQKSKFDDEKFTAALCLSEEQLASLELVGEEILKGLNDVTITEVKSGLYNDKVYVKCDPNLFSAYAEDDDEDEIEFKDLIEMKKYTVNAAVDISSVFVKDGVAHLQLYLHEMVVMKEKKVVKVKRERVKF